VAKPQRPLGDADTARRDVDAAPAPARPPTLGEAAAFDLADQMIGRQRGNPSKISSAESIDLLAPASRACGRPGSPAPWGR